jgi:hypothetical protein
LFLGKRIERWLRDSLDKTMQIRGVFPQSMDYHYIADRCKISTGNKKGVVTELATTLKMKFCRLLRPVQQKTRHPKRRRVLISIEK